MDESASACRRVGCFEGVAPRPAQERFLTLATGAGPEAFETRAASAFPQTAYGQFNELEQTDRSALFCSATWRLRGAAARDGSTTVSELFSGISNAR